MLFHHKKLIGACVPVCALLALTAAVTARTPESKAVSVGSTPQAVETYLVPTALPPLLPPSTTTTEPEVSSPPTPLSTPETQAPSPQVTMTQSSQAFLSCVRTRESGGNYTIHESSGTSSAAGAYQFLPSTWDNTAKAAGRFDLVGMDPASASPADQDALAQFLYNWQGTAPWGGYCN